MWVIIQTTPQGQLRAIEHLQGAGFEVYCPMETVWKRTKRDKMKLRRPLIAGYVFAKDVAGGHDPRRVWRATQLDGIRGVIIPSASDHNFGHAMQALSSAEQDGAFDKTEEKRDRFTEGTKVIIHAEGKLHGQVATVISAARNGDVKLLLNAILKWETTQHIDDLEVAA